MQNAIARHPAKYTANLLPVFANILANECEDITTVLDPMAGVGTIFQLLKWLPDVMFTAVELEPAWARQHPWTNVGNILHLQYPNNYFDAILTSPPYGNRMADHHAAHDISKRNTYRHALGQPLAADNAGILQWGPAYREFFKQAWRECYRVCGQYFILNIKNHVRRGKEIDVTGWHRETLYAMGYRRVATHQVACPGNRYGENGKARIDYETILVLRKAAA